MADSKLKSFARIVTSLSALAFLAGVASAASQPTLPFDNSVVFGDFNGDRNTDTIALHLDSLTVASASYTVRVSLSGSEGDAITAVVVDGRRVELIPRDVDGDRDLDLIVSTVVTHEPVRVLINNGRGRFAAASPREFSGALWHETGQISTQTYQADESACDGDAPTDSASPATTRFEAAPDTSSALTAYRPLSVAVAPVQSGRTRGPPRF
jgi:hypothetical protein